MITKKILAQCDDLPACEIDVTTAVLEVLNHSRVVACAAPNAERIQEWMVTLDLGDVDLHTLQAALRRMNREGVIEGHYIEYRRRRGMRYSVTGDRAGTKGAS